MTTARWQRISELFEAALDLPAGERADFLREQCPEADLRSEVAAMLAADDGASQALAARVPTLPTMPMAEGVSDAHAGMQIGPYELEEESGRGGMGSVWRARRIGGGFSQTVAIKLIKRGMDSREILSRFSQERQILSLLNHPNIARLLDGGETSDGRPYLVMEYVEGQPVVGFCGTQPLPAVLGLFRSICAAVQHAHSNLIIHRDLKPANILITKLGEAKLLDFGIAKLLEQDAAGMETRTGVRMFTPGFASPEQQAGIPCSTATDIYALGAVLRVMLPPNPGPDLDAIIARATRDEPAMRYATVNQLSEDVLRHMEGRPVEARKGNFSYIAGKFLRRHKWGVAAALAFVALLSGTLVSTLYQSRQIARERDRAEVVSKFLSGLFAAADPERNQGNKLTIRELLDDGLSRARAIESETMRQPLMETIATAYFNLGLYDKSIALHEELERSYRGDGARLALTQGYLAEAEAARGRREPAEAWGVRAVQTARGLRPANLEALALTLHHRCVQLYQAARFDVSADACREADDAASRAGLPPAARARILVSLGRTLQDFNKLQEAEKTYQAAMPFASAASTEMNSTSADVLSGLASLYYHQDKFPQAEATLRRAIGFKRKLYPNGHVDLARALNNLGNIVSSQERDREAVSIFEEAHQYYRQALGPESSELASSLSNLAMAKSFLKEPEEAARLMEQVVDMQSRTAGAGQLPHLNSQLKYSSLVSEDLGQPAKARPILESALAGLERLKPQPAMQIGYAKSMLAFCLLEAGQAAAAEKLTAESEAGLIKALPPTHRLLNHVHIVRAGSLLRLGRLQEARALLAPIVESQAKNQDPGWRTVQARRFWAEIAAHKAAAGPR